MKRRTVLRAGAAGALLSIWPSWLARAFDPNASCAGPAERLEQLFDEYRAARRAKKPLLVLVIPSDDTQKWERGELLGEVLNHGDDETLASLALVHLTCATLEDLSHLVELDATSDALLVTIDTAARPAKVERWVFEPSKPPAPPTGDDIEAYRAFDAAFERFIDQRIARLGALVRNAVAQVAPASVGASAAGSDFQAERAARALLDGEAIAPELVLHVAGALHERASKVSPQREKLIAGLAAAVRAEMIAKPVPGSRWGHSGGCGMSIEGVSPDENLAVACGMGRVSAKSARFLYLFTRLPWEQP